MSAWTFWSLATALVLGSGAVAASYGPFHGGWRAIVWVAVLVSLVSTVVVLVLRARTTSGPARSRSRSRQKQRRSAPVRLLGHEVADELGGIERVVVATGRWGT